MEDIIQLFPGYININKQFDLTLICKIKTEQNMNTGFFYKIENSLYCVTNRTEIENYNQVTVCYNCIDNWNITSECLLIDSSNFIYHPDSQVNLCLIRINDNLDAYNIFSLSNNNIILYRNNIDTFSSRMSLYPDVFIRGYGIDSWNLCYPYNRFGTLLSCMLDDTDKNCCDQKYNFICDIQGNNGYYGAPVFISIPRFGITDKCLFLGVNTLNPICVTEEVPRNTTRDKINEKMMQSYVIDGKKILDIENII